MRRLWFSWKYALIILGLVLLAYLVMDFNSRVVNMRRLSAQKEAAEEQLRELEREKAYLQTQIVEATQEEAVIRWAYEDGHLRKPGDNPVVPLPAVESTPIPTPTPQAQYPTVNNWQMWLLLFVDSITP